MKRNISLAALTVLLSATTASAVLAHAPEDLDPRLTGFPELTIALTEDQIEAPASATAGPTLLTVALIDADDAATAGHAFVLRVPDDVSEAQIAEILSGGGVAETVPDWFWQAQFLGNGDRATPDHPGVALIDLKPGRYLAGDPYRPGTEYARFAVSDASDGVPAPIEAIAADVSVELFEMGFRMPDQISAGRHVWEISNSGAMLHEIAIFPAPTGATKEQVQTAITAELEAEYGGDPTVTRATIDGLGPEWVNWSSKLVAGVGVLSPQHSTLAQINLEPGTYGAICYIPEPNSMTPHVMFGMTEVFTVTDQGV